MDIQEIEIAQIKPAEYNPRKDLKPGDAELEKLRAVIDRFDLVEPLVWNRRTGNLVGGHQRLKILKARGDVTVQAVVVDLDDAEERALNVALNQVQGDWDLPKLSELLGELKAANFDLSLTGFDIDELTSLMAPPLSLGLTDEDVAPEPPKALTSKPGDLWILGRHRLLCGNSTVATDVSRLLSDTTPLLMVTDPPYGVNYDPGWRNEAARAGKIAFAARREGKVANDDRADWAEAYVLFPGAVAYVWHASLFGKSVQESLERCDFDLRSQIIWAKSRFAISRGHYHWQHECCFYAVKKGANGNWQGDHSQTTLWQVEAVAGEEAKNNHSTQKPVELMRRPIVNHSHPEQAVYEPFCGSGSTIIAAETTARACYAMDIDPAYVDVAVLRWQSYTGQAAILDGSSQTFEEIGRRRHVQKAG
jgi:DNA modification methylase